MLMIFSNFIYPEDVLACSQFLATEPFPQLSDPLHTVKKCTTYVFNSTYVFRLRFRTIILQAIFISLTKFLDQISWIILSVYILW